MKLHLPKRLLASVLLCISALATDVYATTLDDATLSIASFTQDNLDALTDAGWTLSGFDGNIQEGVFTSTSTAATIAPGTSGSTLTTVQQGYDKRKTWSAIVTVKVDSLTDNMAVLLNGAGLGLGASNSTVYGTWNGGTTWGGHSLTLPYAYNNGDGTVTLGIVYEGETGATLYVGNNSLNENSLKGQQVATNIALTNATGIEYTNLYWFNTAVSGTDMQTMLGTFDKHQELTWSGTAGDNTWDADSENWKKGEAIVPFGTRDNYNVIFSDSADVSKTVDVSGSQTVDAMTLQDSYTFNLQEGASVTASSIDVAADKALSLSGSGTVCVGILSLDGNAAVNMADSVQMDVSSLTLNSSSAISMTGDASISAASITLKDGTDNTLGNVVLRENMNLVANGNSTLEVQKFTVHSEAAAGQLLSLQGRGTLTISGESTFKNVCLVGADLAVNANTTMAELRTESGSSNSDITVAADATLTLGQFLNSWGVNSLEVNGTLNVSELLQVSSSSSGDNVIKGTGTINAKKLTVKNYTANLVFKEGVTLNLGSGGIGSDTTHDVRFGDMTLGVADGETGWSATGNHIQLVNAETGTNIAPGEDQSITISGNIGGAGKLVKTGAGTLVLGGTNAYTGGTTVTEGLLQANSAGAFGTAGAVSVSGGTLEIGAAVDLGDRLTQTGGVISVTTGNSLTLGTTAVSNLSGEGALIVAAGETLAAGGVIGSTTLGEGASLKVTSSFTTGNETITGLATDTAAVISGTGRVSVATESIIYTNALIDVTAASGISSIAATLSNSRVVNSNSSSVVEVSAGSLADGSNDVTAAEGNITINNVGDDGVTVKNLTVQEGNTISASTADGGGSSATINVAGTAALENGSTVGGSVTIADSGTLVISGTGFSADGFGAMVEGTLTANATAVSLAEGSKIDVTGITTSTTYVLATALGMDIAGDFAVGNFYTGTLAEGMSVSVSVVQPMGSGTYTIDSATASQLVLTLTAADPGTLTQTAVAENGVSVTGTNITLTVTDSLAGVTGGFNVTVGEEAWQAIVDGMAPSGGIYQNATVTLTDGTNTLDWSSAEGPVTLNKYAGTGTKGEYFVAYIPEPATATLSLLALAALAARRRRK